LRESPVTLSDGAGPPEGGPEAPFAPGSRVDYSRSSPLKAVKVLLGVVCLGLAGGLAWALGGPDLPEEATTTTEPLTAVQTALLQDSFDTEYRALLARQELFVLPVPTAVGRGVEEAVARAKERVALRAIVELDGQMGAYFEVEKGSGTEFGLYREGDSVGEFTVERIEPGKVTLTITGHKVSFSL